MYTKKSDTVCAEPPSVYQWLSEGAISVSAGRYSAMVSGDWVRVHWERDGHKIRFFIPLSEIDDMVTALKAAKMDVFNKELQDIFSKDNE